MKRKIKSLLVILAIVSAGLLMSILLLPNLYVSKVKVGSIPLYEYEKTCYMNCDKLKVNTFEDLLSVSSALSVNNQRVKDDKIRKHQLEREEKMKVLREGRLARKKEARRLELIAERKRVEALELRKAKHKEAIASNPVEVSRGSGRSVSYEVTHYTAFCNTGCVGVTATSYDVSNTIYYQGMRIVAAPPNIPFYTKLRITYRNGNSFNAIVLDRGGAIRGKNILDVLVSSKSEAYALGRQQVKVEVLH